MDTIYIGSDHGGFESKKSLASFLKTKGYEVIDEGPLSYDKDDDYPDYAEKVCNQVASKGGKGILICRSGNGMAITANKIKGIFASLCWNEKSARMAKVDGNTNVLCLAGDFSNADEMNKIADTWLSTKYDAEERHARRQNKIREIEKKHSK